MKIPSSFNGWLALLGGGEFTFEETADADGAWLEKVPPGPIGFVPAASGSLDYAEHFKQYMAEVYERQVETIPIYRPRDARRGRNCERLGACAAVYLGGGVADHLVEALAGSPAEEALRAKLAGGGVVVAIAAAAQACGQMFRSIAGGRPAPGLGWLPGGVVDTNFDPVHDRRLRALMAAEGIAWGVGVPAEGALLLGPAGAIETVGTCYGLASATAEVEPFGE